MTEIAHSRLAAARWGPGEIALALVGLAWIGLAAFWAAPAILIVDGFVYHAMIDAFARNGSLFVENGYADYRSEALVLHQLRAVDGRLAPQYPGGWGILAAPAYLAGGLRGVMLINAVASALTLPLIWQAARALFDDHRLATHAALIWGLATFAADYALAVWPHGVTTFLVTAALAAGLVLGLGANIRVDALFAAAPLGVWLLGAGRRPYAAFGLLLAGLAPGLAAAAAINYAKFGIPSPVTYGASGGGVTIAYYAGLAPLAAAGALAALALGSARVRARVYTPAGLAALLAVGFALILALPPLREAGLRIARGFWILVADFQAHPLPAHGMAEAADGTIYTFGVLKQALLQSLPYAAVVIVLLPRLWRGPDRAALALCFLFVALILVPFAYGTWHGGASKNMRYFLNLLPALAILTAAALHAIGAMAGRRSALPTLAVLAVAGAAVLYGTLRGYGPSYIVQVTLPNVIAMSAAALALAVLAAGAARGRAASTLGAVVSLGLLSAFVSAWGVDLLTSQFQRAENLAAAERSRDLPPDALVVTFNPRDLAIRVNRPPALTGQADFHTGEVSPALTALVARAFAEGRPVFAQGRLVAEQLVAQGASAAFSPRYGVAERIEIYRMAPPGAAGAPQ